QFFEVDEDSFFHLRNIVYFSYKQSNDGGGGEILEAGDDVDDESLYLDLDASGKAAPLPDNYLDEINGGDSDHDDDADDEIKTHVSRYQEEDD
ncbi:MAG: hypothetical protein KAS94_06950, partial [Desulfobulbaceae bacterium]|nr:hypothetical protein [Desulfobulbaceae bacterium]